VHLRGEKYAAVRDSRDPLAKALIENYRIWCGDHPERAKDASSTLFDTVAVWLAFAEDLVTIEKLPIRVTPEGMTVIEPGAKELRVATEWKSLQKFEDLLVRRLSAPPPGR
jgi:inosine-uridine nucleoside N-ribohydrolase